MALSRADTSVLGRWWWTVDRWTLAALLSLVGFGYVMLLAASPGVAERIGASSRDIFILKQVFFLAAATAVMVSISVMPVKLVRRLALLGCIGALLMTMATLSVGVEIKGARRWLHLPGLTIQPSEFMKPCFAVVAAWLLAEGRNYGWRAYAAVGALFILIIGTLAKQPDMGMLMVVASVFCAQLFVVGINIILVAGCGVVGVLGAIGAYFTMPHFRDRLDRFLDPASGDTYQVTVAMEAFGHGGLLGVGPGEGRLKAMLPDAHADFVYAVAGEEFGMMICLLILGIFGFIVLRGLLRLLGERDMFIILGATGLLTQFGLQAFINMASTLHLIPTKGMTLPFISYGGSSVIAVALGAGMLLALTRRRISRAAQDEE
ncbi:FtsW/RodA/SpoVE family cell cycle protein [Pseudoroseomonas ludipueritiae]|uniref:Probable peptidoglycan glycosyltransferase FtsW n=1 Tax=Pseudoroseomonas ludipueritiae TaxID=198093 RepID=A0ABR7RDF5_9PROT|nr:putative peptidoglycan glycosyltransferase FtsW [Pseudoroseomonas ludipueritiae]MBC9179688.1 cell division protein FtsW [Pseudoroseomonas ludipueritiae]MCG7361577.1 putative lipid II flippase FtsW [Roseomonas sp. ACRSG]